jgi:flagellum-specific peptidoglycan hydrolase FlgJ
MDINLRAATAAIKKRFGSGAPPPAETPLPTIEPQPAGATPAPQTLRQTGPLPTPTPADARSMPHPQEPLPPNPAAAAKPGPVSASTGLSAAPGPGYSQPNFTMPNQGATLNGDAPPRAAPGSPVVDLRSPYRTYTPGQLEPETPYSQVEPGARALAKINKVVGPAAVALTGGKIANDAYHQSQALDDNLDRVALAGEQAGRFSSTTLGGIAGAKAGALAGTAILPGPGTVVGSLAGGLIGGGLGYFAPEAVKKTTDFLGLTDESTLLPSDKANAIIAKNANATPAEPPVDMTPNDTPRGSVADSIARGAPEPLPEPEAAPTPTLRQPYAPGQIAMSGFDAQGSYYYTGDGRMLRPEAKGGLSEADAQIVANYNANPTLRSQEQQPQAPQQLAAPAQPANPAVSAFQQQYGAAAEKAGQALGVDPKLLLAKWGGETAWGKSVIPGTNNLGNIKDFTGGGVRATDNMTGSSDKYRKFDSADAFADHYAELIKRKYPNAVGAGTDPAKFTAGIKGYAEDPQYGDKIKAAYAMLGGQGTAPQAAASQQAAPRSLRDQSVHVVNAGGLDNYYEVPNGSGGYSNVPHGVFDAGVAKGDLKGAVNGFRAAQAEGMADRVDPNRLERSKAAAQNELAKATREHTAEINRSNMANVKADNERADLAAREASSKHLDERLSRVLVKRNDKNETVPDVARVAEANSLIHAEVGHQMRALNAKFQPGEPGYEEAQARIKLLHDKGVAAFGEDDMQVLMSQFQIMERAKALQGPWTPGGSEFVESPLAGYAIDDNATKDHGSKWFGSNMAVLKNGTRVRKNDLRFDTPSNQFVWDFGKVDTQKFNPGLRGR